MPRSPSTPKSQPMSSYLLYSSLVFCHSQAPISITAKHLAQPQFPSLPCSAKMLTISTGQVIFPRAVTRRPHLIFRPQVSWWPEVEYIGRIVLHQQFPIQFLYFLLIHYCFNTPDPHHPHSTWLLTPKPKPTPRSIPTPRFQPMSSYPLYSSLMFCHSQVPISVATKHLA